MAQQRVERKQLQRMLYLCVLLKQNRYPNATRFTDYLRKRDLENNENLACSGKTFQRYIKILQEEFNAPLDYDHGRRGYYLTDKTWQWRTLTLSENGVLAWMLASHAAEAVYPSAVSNTILDEMSEGMVGNSSEELGDAQLDALVVGGETKVPVPAEVVKTAFDAWKQQRCIRFSYVSPWKPDSTAQKRCLEPHVLGVKQGVWYAFGYDADTGGERTFALHRMHDLALGNYFESDRQLIERCQRDGFLVYTPLTNVQLHCTADIADFIRERSPTWTLAPIADEQFPFAVTIPEIQDQQLIAWILNRRGKAKLMSHPQLCYTINLTAQKLADLHK